MYKFTIYLKEADKDVILATREGSTDKPPCFKDFEGDLKVTSWLDKEVSPATCYSVTYNGKPLGNVRELDNDAGWVEVGEGHLVALQIFTPVTAMPWKGVTGLKRLLSKKCRSCFYFDKDVGHSLYTEDTHVLEDGSWRQMRRDVTELIAEQQKIRGIDEDSIGFCREHDMLIEDKSPRCPNWKRK